MWNKGWGGCDLFLQLTWTATSPARNRNEKRITHTTAGKTPLAPAQAQFQKVSERSDTYSRRLWESRRPCHSRSSAGRRGTTWGRAATICLALLGETETTDQSGCRVNKLCCACHVFVLFFDSVFSWPVQNNTTFRDEGFSSFPWLNQQLKKHLRC